MIKKLTIFSSAIMVMASKISISFADESLYPQFSRIDLQGWHMLASPIFSMRLTKTSTDTYTKEVGYMRSAFPPGAFRTTNKSKVVMEGHGSKLFKCPTDYVITDIKFERGNDNSIIAFSCTELKSSLYVNAGGIVNYYTLHSGSTTSTFPLISGKTVWCAENEFVVGLDYQDVSVSQNHSDDNTINDHVTKITCRYFEYIQ